MVQEVKGTGASLSRPWTISQDSPACGPNKADRGGTGEGTRPATATESAAATNLAVAGALERPAVLRFHRAASRTERRECNRRILERHAAVRDRGSGAVKEEP
jgi:hypothetical protein